MSTRKPSKHAETIGKAADSILHLMECSLAEGLGGWFQAEDFHRSFPRNIIQPALNLLASDGSLKTREREGVRQYALKHV